MSHYFFAHDKLMRCYKNDDGNQRPPKWKVIGGISVFQVPELSWGKDWTSRNLGDILNEERVQSDGCTKEYIET